MVMKNKNSNLNVSGSQEHAFEAQEAYGVFKGLFDRIEPMLQPAEANDYMWKAEEAIHFVKTDTCRKFAGKGRDIGSVYWESRYDSDGRNTTRAGSIMRNAFNLEKNFSDGERIRADVYANGVTIVETFNADGAGVNLGEPEAMNFIRTVANEIQDTLDQYQAGITSE